MSKQKKIVLSAVITIVMIGAIVYAFYPSIQSFAYRIVSGSLINNTDNNHTEIKPPVINNGSDNDETKPPYHSTGDENTIPTTIPNAYSEYYWEEIELGKMQDYSYITEILKNREKMLEEGKNRKVYHEVRQGLYTYSCGVGFDNSISSSGYKFFCIWCRYF